MILAKADNTANSNTANGKLLIDACVDLMKSIFGENKFGSWYIASTITNAELIPLMTFVLNAVQLNVPYHGAIGALSSLRFIANASVVHPPQQIYFFDTNVEATG